MHQPTIATCVEVRMGIKGLEDDSGERGSTKVVQELREGWGEMER